MDINLESEPGGAVTATYKSCCVCYRVLAWSCCICNPQQMLMHPQKVHLEIVSFFCNLLYTGKFFYMILEP
jgi:hypothetical protein